NFVVPQGLQGCYVNVAVRISGIVSNFVSIALDPSGSGACSDPDTFPSGDLTAAKTKGSLNLGAVSLSRNNLAITVPGLTIPITSDSATGVFGTFSTTQLDSFLGFAVAPSLGGCATNLFTGVDPTPVDPILPTILDAGASLTVTGSSAKQVAKNSSG